MRACSSVTRRAYLCPYVLDDLKRAKINRIIQNDLEDNDLASENSDVRSLHAVRQIMKWITAEDVRLEN